MRGSRAAKNCCKPRICRTSVAAARSTLSMPTPARPTTRSLPFDASNTARVTCTQPTENARDVGILRHWHGASWSCLGCAADDQSIHKRNLGTELLRRQVVAAIDVAILPQHFHACRAPYTLVGAGPGYSCSRGKASARPRGRTAIAKLFGNQDGGLASGGAAAHHCNGKKYAELVAAQRVCTNKLRQQRRAAPCILRAPAAMRPRAATARRAVPERTSAGRTQGAARGSAAVAAAPRGCGRRTATASASGTVSVFIVAEWRREWCGGVASEALCEPSQTTGRNVSEKVTQAFPRAREGDDRGREEHSHAGGVASCAAAALPHFGKDLPSCSKFCDPPASGRPPQRGACAGWCHQHDEQHSLEEGCCAGGAAAKGSCIDPLPHYSARQQSTAQKLSATRRLAHVLQEDTVETALNDLNKKYRYMEVRSK